MEHIRARIDERLGDETRIKRLLILEKARRGVTKNDLVFVAISTIAQYYWCGMKAVFQSRQEEPAVFASYLEERLSHAHRLGLIDDLPDSDAALLTVGREITFDHIQWGRYVVIGAPDGITDRFVYEFKSTGNPYRMRPIASAQADIYGYFFQRDYKRVQIYLMDKGTVETQEEKVSREQAERVLRDFSRVDQGWLPPAPMQDKCKNCEYRHGCPLRASLSNYAVQQSLL